MYKVKGNVNLSICLLIKHCVMKMYGAVGRAEHIFTPLPRNEGEWWDTNMSHSLYPSRKGTWYSLCMKLVGPVNKSGCCDEEKNPYSHQESKPDSLVIQLVA
jgi:hypothetical protein